MRRISVWLGLGLLALLCLALVPWGVSAYSGGSHAPKAVPVSTGNVTASGAHGAGYESAWQAPNLGVPLRDRWWESVPGIDPATKLSYNLQSALEASPNAQQGFMVYLKAQGDTSNNITDWNAKGEYVLHVLETVQQHTQPALMQAIDAQKATGNVTEATGFTIINAVFVHGNMDAATTIARLPDVAFIEPDHLYHPDSTTSGTSTGGAANLLSALNS